VRSDDDARSGCWRSGVQTWSGDLHDGRTLAPALDGSGSVYVAYPVAAGVATALANVASVTRELGSVAPRGDQFARTGDLDSPSGISAGVCPWEELMVELG